MTGVFDRLTTWFDRIAAIVARPRILGLVIGLPTTVVLALALWLTPEAEGVGTHMQLGLGGCAMLTLTGWPCPMCGMTTTFTLLAHLRPWDALVNQPFGVVLFSLTVLGSVLGLIDLITGRGVLHRAFRWVGRREQLLALGLLFGMFGGWVYKCIRMHPTLLSEVFSVVSTSAA